MKTLLYAVSHNYVIVSLLIIQQQSSSLFMAINLKYKFKSYRVLNLIQGAHPQTLKGTDLIY